MNAPEILELLDGVRTHHGSWQARCPAHEDRSPSLSVAWGRDGRTLLTCFAGCATEDVVAAVGWTMKHLAGDHEWEPTPALVRPVWRSKPVPEDEQATVADMVSAAATRLAGLPLQHEANGYVRTRFGLERADVLRLRLGYVERLGGSPRLVVPFCDTWGTVRGWQARALRDDTRARWLSATSPTEGEWLKAGWFRGHEADAAICVTEGPGDALSAVALGFHAIAVRGSGLARNHDVQELIRRWVGARSVLLCGDGDEAGARFNDELGGVLLRSRVAQMDDGDDLTQRRIRDEEECRTWLIGQAA